MLFASQRAIPVSHHKPGSPTATVVIRGRRGKSILGLARTHFATSRFHRTVELIGACVMMMVFLVLALFA